jgi:hypothetical protein
MALQHGHDEPCSFVDAWLATSLRCSTLGDNLSTVPRLHIAMGQPESVATDIAMAQSECLAMPRVWPTQLFATIVHLREYKKGRGRPHYPFYHVNVPIMFIHSKSPTYSRNPLLRLTFHVRLLCLETNRKLSPKS